MMDSRTPSAKDEWAKTVAVNLLYAERHNHSFTLFRVSRGPILTDLGEGAQRVAWCKVQALRRVIASVEAEGRDASCTWLLYLDSDALVNDHTQAVSTFVRAQLLEPRQRERTHFMVAREEAYGKQFKRPHMLNSGVLFVRASPWSTQMLDAWARARTHECTVEPVPPIWEQGCLERLLNDPTWKQHLKFDERVYLSPMLAFNSPWGRFVRHLWGGPGHEMKASVPRSVLAHLGFHTPEALAQILRRAHARTEPLTC